MLSGLYTKSKVISTGFFVGWRLKTMQRASSAMPALCQNPAQNGIHNRNEDCCDQGRRQVFNLKIVNDLVGHPKKEGIDDQLEQPKGDKYQWQGEKREQAADNDIDDAVYQGDNQGRPVAFNVYARQQLRDSKDNYTEQ